MSDMENVRIYWNEKVGSLQVERCKKYWLYQRMSDVKGIDMVSICIDTYRYQKVSIPIDSYSFSLYVLLLPFARLKILWFAKEVFLIFQVFQNLPLKLIPIFSYIPISEVTPKFSLKFR